MYFHHVYPNAVAALRQRRARLLQALGDTPAVISAGTPRARNYPANTYDFRASSHFLYLIGVPVVDGVLVLADGRCELFAPPMAPDDPLWHGEQPGPDELQAVTGVDAVRPLPELAARLARLGSAGHLPAASVADRTAADDRLIHAILALRLVHDDFAVHELRRAAAVTAQAHEAGRQASRPGTPVAAVRAAMERPIQAADFTTAYCSIVTVRGEVLHNFDRTGTCQAGDLLLADVGSESDSGWASDVTRTWPVADRLSPSQRAMYELVLAAQKAAIAAVRPGVRYRDVHFAACRVLASGLRDEGLLSGDVDSLVERGAHALFFPHGVGHLLGLDVHDMEDLGDLAGYAPGRSRSSQFGLCYLRLDRDLTSGMAVTIEPGLYFVPAILNSDALTASFRDVLRRDALPRFADVRGIRIEDDILVTDSGCDVLTAAIPKEVAAIER